MHVKVNNGTLSIPAILTLALYLFWCTIGISSHDHDAFGNSFATSRTATHSNTPVQSIGHLGSAFVPQGPDQCPACSFDMASVSGAISSGIAVVRPIAISQRFAERTMPRIAATVGTTSRGPPSAA